MVTEFGDQVPIRCAMKILREVVVVVVGPQAQLPAGLLSVFPCLDRSLSEWVTIHNIDGSTNSIQLQSRVFDKHKGAYDGRHLHLM